jgi:hypothetical protein
MLIHAEHLQNGLTVEFHDRSNRYFGDYHRLHLEVLCRLPLTPTLFAHEADPRGACEEARRLLGPEAVHRRTLERMGVAGGELEATRRALIDDFLRSTLPYLENPLYPSRMLASELTRRRHGGRTTALRHD